MEIKLKKRNSFRRFFHALSLVGKDARADWTFLFILFFLLNIGVIWGSVYLLNKVNHGELFQQKERNRRTVDTVSRERLDRIIGTYDEKEKRFTTLKREGEYLVDPAQ